MHFINLFIFNFLFNSLFFQRLFERNLNISIDNLNNIQNDFVRIGFPFSLTINFYFVSLIVTIFTTFLIYLTIPRLLKINTPDIYLKEVLKILINYSAVLFGVLYILRFFYFSRAILIVGVLIYTLSSYSLIWFFRLEKFQNNLYKYIVPFLFIVLIVSNNILRMQNSNQGASIEVTTTTTTTTLFNPIIVESECFRWYGSKNFKDCISGAEIKNEYNYDDRITNIIVEEDIYLLLNSGIIVNHTQDITFLDISNKVGVFDEFFESGIFSLAFHPSNKFFIVSYSDRENILTFEKYFLLENNQVDTENSEILLRIPNSQCCHYSGNIIWSSYFDDFLISVGDMETNGYSERINVPLLNSEPLDTTSPRGKVLFLNKNISKPDLLSLEPNDIPKNNILAYGLRNPWKTSEYKNYLFIPDPGFNLQNELNVLDLDKFNNTKKPYLFGWPHFEGTINNEINFNEILLHVDNKSVGINDYILKNSLKPVVYYQQSTPEVYRGAIIGGGVISDINSEYFEHYIFADYVSKELFLYNFKKDELFIVPLNNIDSYITSLNIDPVKKDTLLISTGKGSFVEIKLP